MVPVLLPFALAKHVIGKYQDYRQDEFRSTLKYVMLQIRPPQEVTKSPAAFELFLGSLYDTGREQTWIKTQIQGKVRPEFSLEIAGHDGILHFYIRCEVETRERVEAQLYAQYPGIEISEAPDYVRNVNFNLTDYNLWFAEFSLATKDIYPIKTYIDFGLDKETDDDYRIDPLTPVLEFMGSLPRGYSVWMQLIIKAHAKDDKKPGTLFGKTDGWVDEAKAEIKKLREEAVTEVDLGNGIKTALTNPTKGQQQKIEALERTLSKLGFKVGMRIMYVAPKDIFSKAYVGSFLGAFRHFGDNNLNGLKPKYKPGFDYPWQDPTGKKEKEQKLEAFKAYKNREWFGNSKKTYRLIGPSGRDMRKHMILTTEELATIYHFPGRVSYTPGIVRAESKRGTPPSNLPV